MGNCSSIKVWFVEHLSEFLNVIVKLYLYFNNVVQRRKFVDNFGTPIIESKPSSFVFF